MKKLFILLVLGFTLFGCAFLQSQKANWDACKSDPDCYQAAKTWKENVTTATVPVASLIPVPGAAALPTASGYIAFGLAMLLGGHAVLKKNNTTT